MRDPFPFLNTDAFLYVAVLALIALWFTARRSDKKDITCVHRRPPPEAAGRAVEEFIDAVEQRRGKAEADPMRHVWSQIRDQVLAHPE